MSVRSLNKVLLIGNLTRDPELRYTPAGTAVCSFGLATNRSWTTDTGEKREETEFHRIVAWNKLAELCSQLLTKGRKIYVEGRLQTRSWQAADGNQRTTTEIVIEDMIILDSRKFAPGGAGETAEAGAETSVVPQATAADDSAAASATKQKKGKREEKIEKVEQAGTAESEEPKENPPAGGNDQEINPDEIPF